jgi:hypothetical protein
VEEVLYVIIMYIEIVEYWECWLRGCTVQTKFHMGRYGCGFFRVYEYLGIGLEGMAIIT